MKRVQLLLIAPAVFIGIFFVQPVAHTVGSFLRPDNFFDTVSSTPFLQIAWFSLWQATISTLATLAIGLPATWALSRYSFRGANLIRGTLTAPFVLPAVVVAAGVLALVDFRGVLPIVWAHIIFNIAVVLRVVGPRWEMLDHRLTDAASTLGARSQQVFVRIVWPEISGAVFNASLLVFIYCFSSFGVIAILGGVSRRTIESEIFTQAVRLGDTQTATSLAILQAIMIGAVALTVRRHSKLQTLASTSQKLQLLSMRPRHRSAIPITTLTALFVITSPLVATLYRSVITDGNFSLAAWGNILSGNLPSLTTSTQSVVFTSVAFAFTAAVICLPLSIIVATVTPRIRALDVLTSLPFALSAATLGIGLIVTFDAHPFAWRSEKWLIPIVHAVIAMPLTIRILQPIFAAIPQQLRNAAQTLGASPLHRWWSIDLAMARPAVLRAGGLSMAISLGEFGATSFLSRSGSTTLPIAIAQLLGRPGVAPQQAGFALSFLMIIITIGIMSRA